MESPARELSRSPENVEAVCKYYLSNGRRSGNYWIVGDVNNHAGRSLFVRLKGPLSGKGARGKWMDGATGEHGDLLDLISAREGYDSIGRALDEARRFLKTPRETIMERGDDDSGGCDTIVLARKIWASSCSIIGTPAEAYLRARKITADLHDAPLRFHPALLYREHPDSPPRKFPALVAAVTNHDGEIMGIHRTFLDPAHNAKACVSSPRRSLGAILGYGVRFGAIGDFDIVGEGIETVLSLKSVAPHLPMVAALSAAHLVAWEFPTGLRRLIIAPDETPRANLLNALRFWALMLKRLCRKARISICDLEHTELERLRRRFGASISLTHRMPNEPFSLRADRRGAIASDLAAT